MITPRARSLADDLRGRSDDELVALLVARPDLARPAPADLTALAARSSTRASTQRALEGLTTGHLQVLEALLATGSPADVEQAATWLGATGGEEQAAFDRALADLDRLALVWRSGAAPSVARTVAEVLGPRPGGLGPGLGTLLAAPPAELADDAALAAVLAAAPQPARQVLDGLTWTSGLLARDEASTRHEGVRWLCEHRLLLPWGEEQLTLPREVALHLRGHRVVQHPALLPPTVPSPTRRADLVALACGGAASTLLAAVDEVAASWGAAPPRVLRAGGLAVKDLRATCSLLDLDATAAALVVEVAHAAGLLADDGAPEPSWAPTPAYDDWLELPAAQRWAHLVAAWAATTRAPHLVGRPGPTGRGTVNALSADAQQPVVRQVRADVLHALASLPEGAAPDVAGVVELVRWRRPLHRVADLPGVVAAVLAEAERLGVTGRGALSPAGRLLVAGAPAAEVASVMAAHLPDPVEQVLLQADLTAVAPGRTEGHLAALLRVATDVESRGGATVHRFSPASVRRALDAGWAAEDLLAALAQVSATPVPQPLTYLVQDVARRHGHVRVASASSYVRAEDPVVLDAVLATPALAALGLRRIAPTVLVSALPGDQVLRALRAAGLAPAAEGADGVVAVPTDPVRRTPPRRRTTPTTLTSLVDEPLARELVTRLRAGQAGTDRRTDDGGDTDEVTDPTAVLTLLRDAAADQVPVRVGYVGPDGDLSRMLLHPRRVEAGRVHGTVGTSEVERVLSIHRVSSASLA